MTSPAFRKLYGDALADQVDSIVRKPTGREVLKPRKPREAEPKAKPEGSPADPEAFESAWWNR